MQKNKFKEIISFIKDLYGRDRFIPLHEPCFISDEKQILNDCIESTFVSSVGEYISEIEKNIAEYTNAKYAVATVNGTSALHLILNELGIDDKSEVITSPITFVATCNAIKYCNADPLFIDIDLEDLSLSPKAMEDFLEKNCFLDDSKNCINKISGKIIKACVLVHVFGNPAKSEDINKICNDWNLHLVEDCAESLGSKKHNKHTGLAGIASCFSFNGNKIITSGGGGMVITNNKKLAKSIKHKSTTAKKNHRWEYIHDTIGFNYRMPNINAALLCAQFRNIEKIILNKRKTALEYENFCKKNDVNFFKESKNSRSNYWLNAISFDSASQKKDFLEISNKDGVMTRPLWLPMYELKMFKNCIRYNIENANVAYNTFVNIPSSYRDT